MSQENPEQPAPSSPPTVTSAPPSPGALEEPPSPASSGSRSTLRMVLRQLFAWPMLVTLVLLLGVEGGLRVAGLPRPPREDLLQGDPFQGWSMPPGKRNDLGIEVQVNRLGMRGAEVTIPKPAGIKRLLTLGDSSIYGFGVSDDAVFSQVVQRTLGQGFEVLNGAVGGYSTVQSLRFLQRNIAQLEPDVLVIGNLWSDNTFDSFVDTELLKAAAIEPPRPTYALYKTFSQSALFRMLERLIQGEKPITYRRIGVSPGHGTRLGLRRVEINDYAQNLDRMVRLGLEHGAHTLFIMLANQDEMGQGANMMRVWEPYRTVMRNTAERYGAPVLELTPLFQASGHPPPALFWDSMHPTVLGHQLLGDAVVALLKERGWPERALMLHPEGSSDPLPRYDDPYLGRIGVVDVPPRPGELQAHGAGQLPVAALSGGNGTGSAAAPLPPQALAAGGPLSGAATAPMPPQNGPAQPGALAGGPANAGAPGQQTWIQGTLEGTLPEVARIQVDLLAPGSGVVMAGALDKDQRFMIPAPVGAYAGIQVIFDAKGDGPDFSDTSRRLEQAFEVQPGEKRHLKVVLDAGTVQWIVP